jgi:hypothetical protein
MTIRKIVKAALLGCVAVGVSASVGFAQQAAKEHQQAATAKAAPQSDMAAKCQAMMAGHEQMMAETKAADLRLDGLVAGMNAATGQPKIDAISVVVSEMVVQRKSMREGMMKMQQDMMAHMMEHMQAGKDSMAMCPMMKMMPSKPMGSMKH